MLTQLKSFHRLSDKIEKDLKKEGFFKFIEFAKKRLEERFSPHAHGDLTRWLKAFQGMDQYLPSAFYFDQNYIQIDFESGSDDLETHLSFLKPWRKGPFQFDQLQLETEWRSDYKWQRLKNSISSLDNKKVLDIGCGNGYHCWRMLEQKPQWVLGIDPNLLFNLQFQWVRQFYTEDNIQLLPMVADDLPEKMQLFDTVFSMGVLYHRKSPIEHLLKIKSLLKPGGEMVLETLVVNGQSNEVLVPQDRYAMMNNVWFIPSARALIQWLKKCGFQNVKLINVSKTRFSEQKQTQWMPFESLKNFLNPENVELTVEGYQAPTRAILLAQKP